LTNYEETFKGVPSYFILKCKIAWGTAQNSRRLKKSRLTTEDEQKLLVDDGFFINREHSAWLVLTSQHSKTLSKILLEKKWEWEAPGPNAENDDENVLWTRICPGIVFGSIHIDDFHRIKRKANRVMRFLNDVDP
jgi:hypothetical protein